MSKPSWTHGKYKTLPNNVMTCRWVSIREFAPPEQVNGELENDLVRLVPRRWTTSIPSCQPPGCINRFVQIHPFQDGNGPSSESFDPFLARQKNSVSPRSWLIERQSGRLSQSLWTRLTTVIWYTAGQASSPSWRCDRSAENWKNRSPGARPQTAIGVCPSLFAQTLEQSKQLEEAKAKRTGGPHTSQISCTPA